MSNYIHSLQEAKARAERQIAALDHNIRQIHAHLQSAKFTSKPLENYINTSDVARLLDAAQQDAAKAADAWKFTPENTYNASHFSGIGAAATCAHVQEKPYFIFEGAIYSTTHNSEPVCEFDPEETFTAHYLTQDR